MVAGGPVFIGNHLADKLMNKQPKLAVLDKLCSGNFKKIHKWLKKTVGISNWFFILQLILKPVVEKQILAFILKTICQPHSTLSEL